MHQFSHFAEFSDFLQQLVEADLVARSTYRWYAYNELSTILPDDVIVELPGDGPFAGMRGRSLGTLSSCALLESFECYSVLFDAPTCPLTI